MNVVIEESAPEDIHAIAELLTEIQEYYGDQELQPLEEREIQVRNALFAGSPLARTLLVKDELNSLVGFASYTYLWPAAGSKYSLYLTELYVKPEQRRHGIGKLLMSAIMNITSKQEGCVRVEWMADSDNPAALRFYKDLDYPELDSKIVYRINI